MTRTSDAPSEASAGAEDAMTMKIQYSGTLRGKKLYTVTSGSDRFFTGTLEEVKRFVMIHNQKVRERQNAFEAHLAAVRAS